MLPTLRPGFSGLPLVYRAAVLSSSTSFLPSYALVDKERRDNEQNCCQGEVDESEQDVPGSVCPVRVTYRRVPQSAYRHDTLTVLTEHSWLVPPWGNRNTPRHDNEVRTPVFLELHYSFLG